MKNETVHVTLAKSPIGTLRFASTEAGLAYVELAHANGRGLRGWIDRCAAGAECCEAFAPNKEAVRQVMEFLEGKRTEFELPLDLRGTSFQRAVWDHLLEIPYGETRAYADVARAVGRPKAVRAVGAANGSNPVPLVVPCHRVIASDGTLGGYGGGLEVKQRLLAMERGRPGADRLL